jgi:hypothetical protein
MIRQLAGEITLVPLPLGGTLRSIGGSPISGVIGDGKEPHGYRREAGDHSPALGFRN